MPYPSPYVIPGLPNKATSMDKTLLELCEIVCSEYGVIFKEIFIKTRYRRIVAPRQMCIYILRLHKPSLSLNNLGKLFDKDHTTILDGLIKTKNDIETDDDTRCKFQFIENRIKLQTKR
jgi:chromosomal replication initiator protein